MNEKTVLPTKPFADRARIISLVPSWTETLLWAGLHVVGRTRFCIHPAAEVARIAVLGGTKGVNVERVLNLRPDFVILDREENKKEMAEALQAAGIQLLVSHVSHFESAAAFLDQLAFAFQEPKLHELAGRYRELEKSEIDFNQFFKACRIDEGVSCPHREIDKENFEYVIWKNPYMVIGKNTFIAQVLRTVGMGVRSGEKYPKIDVAELKKVFGLYSSEPYPFLNEFKQMCAEGFRGIVVDGEKISWYGIRNLLFLESCRK